MNWNPFRLISLKNKFFWAFLTGVVLTSGGLYILNGVMKSTSTNEYCESCHVHPQATKSWKEGPHYMNSSGVVVNCVQCHLPPDGAEYYLEKAEAGARDLYGFYFKDHSTFDWEVKSTFEVASHFVFEESCLSCHQELFPIDLSEKGVDAHLHYRKNREELRCLNCHLKSGHYHDEPDVQILTEADEPGYDEVEMAPLITEIGEGEFADYTEVIPGTNVKFEMVALEGGEFLMGTPSSEPGREGDEGPQRRVGVSPFWMGKFEVSWREYDAYYAETVTRSKNEQGIKSDAITGPTPPYGSPDQGWGKGDRPAITMTHYAAQRYTQWLSEKTGRSYRLPTEAEWEYAARAGTQTAYFFESEEPPSWFDRFTGKLLGGAAVDEELLAQYAWYRGNSRLKSHPSRTLQPNPWGLYHLNGNVKEFCLDFYQPNVLENYPDGETIFDPQGPDSGDEWVVRGGSFRSEPSELRSGARDSTDHKAWLKTDPQTPKSVWWYSDSNEVGFRVVRDSR